MTIRSVWRAVREFLFTKTSKEILLFLFFLGTTQGELVLIYSHLDKVQYFLFDY